MFSAFFLPVRPLLREVPAMSADTKPWALFSRRGHVLIHLAAHPQARVVDLAAELGVTERSIRMMLNSLSRAGFLRVGRRGRNNRYEVNLDAPLTHPIEKNLSLRSVIQLAHGEP